jgi:hypothetical protein
MQVNNRREQRRNASATYSICWKDRAGGLQSAEVQSLDRSNSGTRITCAAELAPGTTVYIECKDRYPRGYSTVRHCTLQGTAYRIGLEFYEGTRNTIPVSTGIDFDYYEFLQISPRAEAATIQRIYRFMASRFHPDNPDTGDPERFLQLKHAYEVLSDPQHRAEYDAKHETTEIRPDPIFKMAEFGNGIEGEVNRRLGVLSLLYNKRRTNSEHPSISLYDLEKLMGWPREYLDFTTWYLRNMQYITREDNSDFGVTALGVNYVESNYTQIPMLNKLLNSAVRSVTGAVPSGGTEHPDSPRELFLMQHSESLADGASDNTRGNTLEPLSKKS